MMLTRHKSPAFKYPGVRAAMDGNSAVIQCERESTDAAGAFPITPSTQMGEGWAENAARGHINISGRPLIFIEPEGEHAAAAVTAGLSMTGLRSANFSSGQGLAYMHESLYAAVGKRLTYVLNVGARAMTKATLNVHAGHDDYHCVDDTGFFQMFAKNAQHAADLNLIAHRIAELALTPGILAQDGFLTTHLIESLLIPERDLVAEYLGKPEDLIDSPTPAQRMIYGDKRRRVPELWDVDNPIMSGLVQNQDAYMQSVAAQRPFFFDHIEALTERAFQEFEELTGRKYARVMGYRTEDAEYLILGQGSLVPSAEAAADYLRRTRKLKVGVVDLLMFRPFPADFIAALLHGKKGVAVLERVDQPLAADLPLMREVRATLSKAMENGRDPRHPPYPELPTYHRLTDAPALYSGCFGLGSRDLQPEGLVAAIENMLPDGAHRRFFYLSVDFAADEPSSPKARIAQERLVRGYPRLKSLALRGSENPNLMPEGSIALRLHSVGGWGAITTGKNLAMTLFDLLGYHVKANPKYGSEKKGQPTTYYMAVAPEPIRVNCEFFYVDVVLSPDPNVFQHTNALAGLREGGVLIIQSELATPELMWKSIPARYQRILIDQKIRVYALDAFRIAREEATDPELQLRMQGIAFQGAFFAVTDVVKRAGLDEARLMEAVRQQIEHKFGSRGARVVEDNLRVIRRGFDEVRSIPHLEPEASHNGAHIRLPVLLERKPQSKSALSDLHRFWEQTGSLYARGRGSDQLADPFIATGTMPAASAIFRDMTGIRFEHPEWIAENCTACGNCYTVCPDTAIPGLVSEIGSVLDAVLRRVRARGAVKHLPRAVRSLEGALRKLLTESSRGDRVDGMIEEAIAEVIAHSELGDQERAELATEFRAFRDELGSFRFASTRPFFDLPEKKQPGSGGLFSITINPTTCKGCMECVQVCGDDALRPIRQTKESIAALRHDWDLWLDLPTTPERFLRLENLEDGGGTLEKLLLDKRNAMAVTSGDGACLGCSEKTVVRLFVATVEALMRPRVEKHVAELDQLIARLDVHLKARLSSDMKLENPALVSELIAESRGADLTLSRIAARLDGADHAVDREWLARVVNLLARLRTLRWRYAEGTTGTGRSSLGLVNSTGCSSVWGSTYPFNPYPFPWTNHLFQDSPSMALGIFEGHMAKMAEGFKAVRQAKLELAEGYDPRRHDQAFGRFDWHAFTDEEWQLCPPVVSMGGDGAMYDIGFQNLSRLMMAGKPIKVVVLDTQVYSNTGGQACTSGFFGQVSDMAPFGQAAAGKREVRKEIGLIGIAHRTTYVMQSTIAHPAHMLQGFIEGLKARRPALFNLYTACQPEHGIGDDRGAAQARLAVESRAYPLFRYDPDRGTTVRECLDLEGNPEPNRDAPTYSLEYVEFKRKRTLQVPMTFADFALTEARFRKHFRTAPPDTWNDKMVPLHEYLDLSQEDRRDKYPYVWTVGRKQELGRLMVGSPIVSSCDDRRAFWRMLRSLSGADSAKTVCEDPEARIRKEVVGKIAQGLARLASSEGGAANGSEDHALDLLAPPPPQDEPDSTAAGSGYVGPWIESDECTSCDECIKLNPHLFAYDENKHAYVKDPSAGTYEQLVKAAERCTASVIHPGLPKEASTPALQKLIERARAFN